MRADLDATGLAPGQCAIEVAANGVSIDGNGLTLSGATASATNTFGVRFNAGVRNGSVRGLSTVGFRYSIYAYQGCSQTTVAECHITKATMKGIDVRGDGARIHRNRVWDIGPPTDLFPHGFSHGIYVIGEQAHISHNMVGLLKPAGSGEGVGITLYEGDGSRIHDNVIDGVAQPEHGRIFAFWVDGKSGDVAWVHDNQVSRVDYALGPTGNYYDNRMCNIGHKPWIDRIWGQGAAQTRVLADFGGNGIIATGHQWVTPGSDVAAAVAAYHAAPTKFSAYATFLGWFEQPDYHQNVRNKDVWWEVSRLEGHELVTSKPVHPDASVRADAQAIYDAAHAP